MARRSQCSSAGDNPLDPNYLPPHYREEYRLAIDALVEEDLEGYYQFLQKADVVDFLSSAEIQYIQECVQVPRQSTHLEQRFLETGGDGSSDTYWPVHSDLDAPGLDLGWPQMHHLIGPTEVTTLVNPPEPDMPSIKEQARRLIKNARQVIAIAMDMFTDVDIFHDILTAATRNVAVYILLDKQNAHHFVNMVSNYRVNLQSIQCLRVRTVSGITYHCRSGKSFKGQMMDRFLLTDCRAVLSGNYSFMWSFEKLHRCMAHLFLGQLVSTFDEEFRILYAQSQPLVIENVLAPMEDLGFLQKRPYLSERPSLYREPRKFLSLDTAHPDDWARPSYDERMDVDWRLMPLRKESVHGPPDIYNRFPSQHTRMDPSFDQGQTRVPMMENPAFKRHSYAEGVHGRYSNPFMPQQGMPEAESQGRQFHRGLQPHPGPGPGPGKEADYGAYEKFWSQDYLVGDQYSEPGLPQEMEPPDNFDPVLNYLSSTRNVDFDQGSEKLPPVADVPFSSSHPRRLSLGQTYPCQTSPTPPNPTEQKQFFPEHRTDRKDPMVKRGLRDWRISSYLSAYDNPEDEGLPLAPPNVPDAFEEPSNIMQQTTSGIDLSAPKIPNVREFKVPAIPRASQMPSYVKTIAREQPKKMPDEPTAVAAETKTTPTPSESSSTTDVEKTEEAESKEPKTAVVHREESFRRKYNAAVQRTSRLRSSLIFSSLEQQHTSQDNKTTPGQQDEESDKNETEQPKQPFVSHGLGQRRSIAREPFEWSRYMKSATFDNSATDSSKPGDESSKAENKDASKKDESSKDLSEKMEVQLPDSSPSMPRSKLSEAELPKTDQPIKPLLTNPSFIDMNDPDMRLMFFKELAAKRKAAKAAEAEKSKEKAPMKPQTELKNATTAKKDEAIPQDTANKMADTAAESVSEKNTTPKDAEKTLSTETCKSVSLSSKSDSKTSKEDSQAKNTPGTTESCKDEQTRVSADSEKTEQNNSQPAPTLSVSAEPETPQSVPSEEPKLSKPVVETSSSSHPPTPTEVAPVDVPPLEQGTDENESRLDSTSKESSSLTPSSVEVQSSAFDALDSDSPSPESVQLDANFSSPLFQSEQPTGSEISSSIPAAQNSSCGYILPDSGTQISPSPSPSSSTILSSPAETITSNVTPEKLSLALNSSILSPNAQENVTPLAQSVEFIQAQPDSVTQLTSSETHSAVDYTCAEPDISLDACATASEPNTTSTTKIDSEKFPAPSEEYVPESENKSAPQVVGEESEVLGSDVKTDSTPPNLSPSSPETCLPNVADLESKSISDQNEMVTSTSSTEDSSFEISLAETTSPVHPNVTPNASQAEVTASPQDPPEQVTPPTKPHLTEPAIHYPVETAPSSSQCSSSLTESFGSVLSPEAKKTLSTLHSSSDTSSLPQQVTTETCSPTEPTSKDPTDLPCKIPEYVTSETQPSKPAVLAENRNMESQNEVSQEPEIADPAERKADDTEATNKVNKTTAQESACSEKINDQVRQNNSSEVPEVTSGEAVSPSPQSKQPKSSQSRYQSSTANVLSSSNLRDDTKLLLEQISANSQNRNEATKESPVTDDEKEDEADKNAIREKERGLRSLSRGQLKSNQDREKLLERIQSMRKERKVYSRFEMAP